MWLPLAPRMLWVARCHESGGVFVGGSRCSAALGLRALGRFVDAGWQDSRAVHDSRGPRSEKRPFLARSSRGVSSDGDLRGISDAWRAYPARASPFSDAWRANLAANWRFSRPRPLSGCMERKTCHGLPPGNASGRNLAIARRPGTHFTGILPSVSARNATAPCASTPQRHVPQRLASQPHRCSRRTPRPCPTCPSLMPPRRPPQRRDAMRRMRRFCRCWKSKLRVTGVNEVKRTTCFGLSAIVPLTY